MKTIRFTIPAVPLVLVLLLAACQMGSAIYLGGGRHFTQVPDSPAVAQLALLSFEEEFSKDEVVGEFITGTQQRQMLIMPRGILARNLDAALKKKMNHYNLAFTSQAEWDLTVEGLARASQFPDVLVGGRIKQFHLRGEQKLLPADYDISMTIECMLGMPGKKKMITRTVQISQGMIKVDGRHETMQEIIDELLDNAAEQTVSKIKGMMREEGLF